MIRPNSDDRTIYYVLLVGGLSLLPNIARSCDACGCGAGQSGIGLLTDYRTDFVRLTTWVPATDQGEAMLPIRMRSTGLHRRT